jgi:hypothetical protein
VSATRPTTHVAALGLSAIAELHCVWATGSPWPLSTREALSDQVAGTTSRKPPSTSACLAVAATLAAAAALVEATREVDRPWPGSDPGPSSPC